MDSEKVIEVPKIDGDVVPVVGTDGRRPFVVDTSMPRRTEADMVAIAAVIDAEEIDKTGHVGEEYELTHWLAHPVVYLSRSTGEYVSSIRVVYPLADGRVIGGSGKPMIESIQRLTVMARRAPPWDPPIRVRLIQRGAGEDGRTFKLLYIGG